MMRVLLVELDALAIDDAIEVNADAGASDSLEHLARLTFLLIIQ